MNMSRESWHGALIQPFLYIKHICQDVSFNGWRVTQAILSDKLEKGLDVVFAHPSECAWERLIDVLVCMSNKKETELYLPGKKKTNIENSNSLSKLWIFFATGITVGNW